MLLDHFKAERALAGDHGLVVKRMNERQAELLRAAYGFVARLVVIRAGQNHFRAIAARRGHFYQRRRQRHADLRLDATLGRVIRHGLRVVSGRCRDHAAPPLFVREQQNFVQRAALLERARHLQIFQLQKYRASRLEGKLFGVRKGRGHNRATNAFPRLLDRA